MNHQDPPGSPLPDPLPFTAEWPTLEEFMKWAREDPQRLAKWEETVRRVEAGELGDLTREVRAAATKCIAARKPYRAMLAVGAKAAELRKLALAPAGAYSDEDRLAETRRLCDEIVDDLLDLPEPHRTELFGRLTPLRDRQKAKH